MSAFGVPYAGAHLTLVAYPSYNELFAPFEAQTETVLCGAKHEFCFVDWHAPNFDA